LTVARFLGEHEEIVEDLLRELVVREQVAGVVGHDELVSLLAVAHRVRVVLVVLDQTDDLELERLAVVRFDDEDVAQLERRRALGISGVAVAVPGAVGSVDDGLLLWA